MSLIGDSVAASIAASGPARGVLAGVDLAVDTRVCRRTATTGCPWRGEVAPSVADVVGATPGDLGDAVVIVSGYNDDARRFRRDATGVLTQLAAQGVPRIVWLDLRVTPAMPAATQARHRAINATLASLDRASPLLRVASWNAHSAGHDAWFFDPIHLRVGRCRGAGPLRPGSAGRDLGRRPRRRTPATRVRSARRPTPQEPVRVARCPAPRRPLEPSAGRGGRRCWPTRGHPTPTLSCGRSARDGSSASSSRDGRPRRSPPCALSCG